VALPPPLNNDNSLKGALATPTTFVWEVLCSNYTYINIFITILEHYFGHVYLIITKLKDIKYFMQKQLFEVFFLIVQNVKQQKLFTTARTCHIYFYFVGTPNMLITCHS
jgi:hypothetical protein